MNQENTTNSTTDIKLDNIIINEDINSKRKQIKEDGITLIDNAIKYFMYITKEEIKIEKIDFLNILIYQCLIFLEINAGKVISLNKEDITSIDAESITESQALAIYELGLWKRINDFQEQHPRLNIFDSIGFLRDIKNYILNVCYKNIN